MPELRHCEPRRGEASSFNEIASASGLAMTFFGKSDKRFLLWMVALIFITRFFASIIVMQARGGELSQDEGLYSKKALMMAFQWKGHKDIEQDFRDYFMNDWDMTQKEYGFNPYTRMLATIYYLFGYQIQTARLLNAFIFIAAFLFVFFAAKELFGTPAAKLASALFAFFPSLFLWSAMICVDITIAACVTGFVFFGVKFLKAKIGVVYLVLMALALIGVRSIRPYIANILAVLMLLAVAYKATMALKARLKPAYLMIALAVAVLICTMPVSRHLFTDKADRAVRQMICNQGGFAVSDDSSYTIYPSGCYEKGGCGPAEFAAGYFRGMAYVLFSPFPWSINSWLQLMSLPQMIIWYFIFPFAVAGACSGLRKDPAPAAMMLLYCLLTLSVLALASGNVGAVFRHRDMVTPFVLIFAAAGILKFKGRPQVR